MVYLDELTLSALYRLIRIRNLTNIIVLEALKPRQRLWRWLLAKKGVNVVEASFFAGHLKTYEGESVYLSARRLSGQIALAAAREVVESEIKLQRLNNSYRRNTIRLFIAKQLHMHIEYWTTRALVAQVLCKTGRAAIWLKKPTLFNEGLLSETLPGVEFRFYRSAGIASLKLVMLWFLDIARDIKLIFAFGHHQKKYSVPARSQKPSVLMLQEDNLRAERRLRGQPHWVDISNPLDTFDTFLIELRSSKFSIAEDASQLSKAGVKILPTSTFRYALQAMRNNKTVIKVRRDRRTIIRAVFRVPGFDRKFFCLRIAALLRQAELMGALALWLNTKVFLIRETYYSFADAMQLVAADLNITTIAYQYSNLGSVSPIMLSTADQFLIFSDMYKSVYQADGIAPQEFLLGGYLYDGVADLVRVKAQRHRDILIRTGARFIVCYFDESVQHDRWGLVSKTDHLGELHALANAVISDTTFAVVVKSQFIHNSPSQLYPNDELIQTAKATGRYLELMEGVHRNDVYPTEAALVADLCIGHKFGATAALEAAIAGVRTVLLDTHGAKTPWDNIYNNADIEYKTMDSLMDAITGIRSGSKVYQTIGDWASILHHFDPYRNGEAVDRLRKVVEQGAINLKRQKDLSQQENPVLVNS